MEEQVPLQTVSENLFLGRAQTLSFNVLHELEWEAWKSNKSRFYVLCKTLNASGYGLLCYVSGLTLDGKRLAPTFKLYYFLIPSEDGYFFLAREIAVKENLLPVIGQFPEIEVPESITNEIRAMLANCPVKDFDPSTKSNNFHEKIGGVLVREPVVGQPVGNGTTCQTEPVQPVRSKSTKQTKQTSPKVAPAKKGIRRINSLVLPGMGPK